MRQGIRQGSIVGKVSQLVFCDGSLVAEALKIGSSKSCLAL